MANSDGGVALLSGLEGEQLETDFLVTAAEAETLSALGELQEM